MYSMSLSADQIVETLRAAGESTRLRVLSLLAGEELSVMELSRILDQSQPRVSRHLKLLTEAGLIERFPDGARVFYRASTEPTAHRFIVTVLDMLDDDPQGGGERAQDHGRLEQVRTERASAAAAYFEQVAPQWDRIRSLYVAETAVEAAIEQIAGPGPFERVVDLGTGSGRMLTLLGRKAKMSIGLDLSHNMLNIARTNVARAGLQKVELRHGDIFSTRLQGASADLVLVHQVLHYLADPHAAVIEAARLVAPGGKVVIVDFAPHTLEAMREEHQHRRLGFADDEIATWLAEAGLTTAPAVILPPDTDGLTVTIWSGVRSFTAQALVPTSIKATAQAQADKDAA
ncbi:metalloregulator ArsR/SmtB family transcription factor [soil metagenome]